MSRLIGRRNQTRQHAPGFTFLEIAVVMSVVAVCAAVALFSSGRLFESSDREAIRSVETSLTKMLQASADRLDISPCSLSQAQSQSVLSLVNIPPEVTVTVEGPIEYRLQVARSNQDVTYRYPDCS